MRQFAPLIAISLAMVVASASAAANELPAWAYPVNPPGAVPVVDDGSAQHVPDSSGALTRKQISAIGGTVADWHPDEHPVMPMIVAKRREPLIIACGYCHLPNGAGRPENASLAGLTANYIKQQVLAFRKEERLGSAPDRLPQTTMISIAKVVTDAEVEEAAAYFAGIKPANFVKVVESGTVPKTVVAGWMLTPAPGGGTEPIGNRIIEVAEDFERFEHRDSRNPFIAYVPVGSVQRGAELIATGGGGKTVQCVTCHGPELRGLLDVPRIIGRSPSYLMRQLHDIKYGSRKGGTAELMKPVVANLTDEDMVVIVAYLASREP
jgi:cytochrome c553